MRGSIPERLAFLARLETPEPPPARGAEIGRGSTSTVYALGDDRVLKVTELADCAIHCSQGARGARFFLKEWAARRHAEATGGRYEPLDFRIVRRRARRVLEASDFYVALVASYALERLREPFFVRMHDAFVHRGVGYQIFDRAEGTLRAALPLLRLTELKQICLQVVYAIHRAQEGCAFLHHDLHLNNVYVRALAPGARLFWDGSYALGTLGALVADFGYADFVFRGHWVLRPDLPLFEERQYWDRAWDEWGAWRHGLAGQRGYDLQTFFKHLEAECERASLPRHRAWVRRAVARLEAEGARTHARGRPLAGFVSDVPPLALRDLFEDLRESPERLPGARYVNAQ